MSEMKQSMHSDAFDCLWTRFQNPDQQYYSIPKWIWNTTLDEIDAQGIRDQFKQFKEHDKYGGVMIVLWGHEGYFTEEFFKRYGEALDIAEELGISIILWDENGFPTGYAGGIFETRYPQYTASRLDMTEITAEGPCSLSQPVPDGTLMGVVAMNTQDGSRVDLTALVDANGILQYAVPEGRWKIMFFCCVKEQAFKLMGGSYRFIDYLDNDAVDRFVGLTHQQYYDRFPQHFGKTIRYAFYDEPSFWRIQGRIWTKGYNQKFEAKFGYSPILYYPALFGDIGSDTQAARNALLGFRADLYATAFVKTMADWCLSHGIQLTGHMDQEEIANPVPLSGDLMKVFEHQHMPGVDEIFKYGRGSKGYKVVSSAAFNYDKPTVMCEAYGAMGVDMPINVLYKDAMDIYAKGINFMVPHGTWYDAQNNVIFPPELSYRNETYGPELPRYNQYIARLSAMLQGGSHVADIAMLYPIASLQAGNVFGQGDAYLGGTIAEDINYMELGEMLSLDIRKDFTYIHPEVLDNKCSISSAEIRLDNAVNRECYKVLMLSGSEVIHMSNVRKIRQFYDQGGKIIAVGRIPSKSAEFGLDDEIRLDMECIFGAEAGKPGSTAQCHEHENGKGGKAYYLPAANRNELKASLENALSVWDLCIADEIETTGGNLTYIHKVIDNMHIIFFANSSDKPVNTHVFLRGAFAPELWDPHTGFRAFADYMHQKKDGVLITKVKMDLMPVSSLFLVSFVQVFDSSVDI